MLTITQERTTRKIDHPSVTAKADPRTIKINLTAPAGSETSLGAENIRDDRPTTCDDVVEAIDEVGPGISARLATEKDSDS